MVIIKATELRGDIEYNSCCTAVQSMFDTIMTELQNCTTHDTFTYDISILKLESETNELKNMLKTLGYNCRLTGTDIKLIW